jgi:hypothetical protein
MAGPSVHNDNTFGKWFPIKQPQARQGVPGMKSIVSSPFDRRFKGPAEKMFR